MIQDFLSSVYDYSVLWQMSPAERFALQNLVKHVDGSKTAIEVGTYCGGSLRTLAKTFKKVYSIDISQKHLQIGIKSTYPHVQFETMDSLVGLGNFIHSVRDEDIAFVLIDANHEYEYVLSDLNNVLTYVPKSEMVILLHDSWYPPSRRAIFDSNLRTNPYVHFVDVDFCHGDAIPTGAVVGGFCLAVLGPQPRTGELMFLQSGEFTYGRLNDSKR